MKRGSTPPWVHHDAKDLALARMFASAVSQLETAQGIGDVDLIRVWQAVIVELRRIADAPRKETP